MTIYEKMCNDKVFAASMLSEAVYGVDFEDGDYEPLVDKIDPSTIGQYTGKSDTSGKRAFEGDIIVPGGYTPDLATGIIRFGTNRPDTSGGIRLEIGFWIEWKGDYSKILRNDVGYWLPKSRIIGNIHDGKDEQHDEL